MGGVTRNLAAQWEPDGYPTYREGLSALHHDGEQISYNTPTS